jgi:hypothetical protein
MELTVCWKTWRDSLVVGGSMQVPDARARPQLANLSPGYLDGLGCIRAVRAQGWIILQFMLAASACSAA